VKKKEVDMPEDLIEKTIADTKKLLGEDTKLRRASPYSFRMSAYYKGKEIVVKVSYRYNPFISYVFPGRGGIELDNASAVEVYVKLTKDQLDNLEAPFARFSIFSIIKRNFRKLPVFTIERGCFRLGAMALIFTGPNIDLITKTIENAIKVSNTSTEDLHNELVWSKKPNGFVPAITALFIIWLIAELVRFWIRHVR